VKLGYRSYAGIFLVAALLFSALQDGYSFLSSCELSFATPLMFAICGKLAIDNRRLSIARGGSWRKAGCIFALVFALCRPDFNISSAFVCQMSLAFSITFPIAKFGCIKHRCCNSESRLLGFPIGNLQVSLGLSLAALVFALQQTASGDVLFIGTMLATCAISCVGTSFLPTRAWILAGSRSLGKPLFRTEP
jgi:hypothetical protein